MSSKHKRPILEIKDGWGQAGMGRISFRPFSCALRFSSTFPQMTISVLPYLCKTRVCMLSVLKTYEN